MQQHNSLPQRHEREDWPSARVEDFRGCTYLVGTIPSRRPATSTAEGHEDGWLGVVTVLRGPVGTILHTVHCKGDGRAAQRCAYEQAFTWLVDWICDSEGLKR